MSRESQLEAFLSLYDKNRMRAEDLGMCDTGSKFGNEGLLPEANERGGMIINFS